MAERYPARKREPSKRKLEHAEEEEASEGSDEHSDGFIKPKLMSSYYNFPELLESKDFEHDGVIQTMSAEDFTKEYIRESGLRVPLIFHDSPEKLGMRMPPADEFTVRDVMNQVGENRRIEVVQVDEQSGKAMLMKDFVEYYEKSEEERGPLLNVLSLEFSATELAETVKPPTFVHDLDWVEKYWPEELKQRQKISVEVHGDACDFSTYPKVQRYCLMSVKGCYTDFHMDFGGTSVWYHVLKGEKIFWVVEPTETNIFLYEEWLRTNGHNEAFFGKAVERCTRVRVHAGDTFIIPSCWIHSVFTPQDSLVFGGNFLHSYAIPGQIRAAQSEDKIRISGKYRYPYFKQMLWYYMEHIVRSGTGRVYLKAIAVDPRKRQTPDNPAGPADEEHPQILRGGIEPEEEDDVLPSEPTVYYDDPKRDDWINVDPDANLFIPCQRRINMQDYQDCIPAESFNQEFLESLSHHEQIGLFKLRDYAKKLVKNHKKQQFAEGITRPRHLLTEFDSILEHCFAGVKEELANEESPRSARRRTRQSRVSVESNTSNEAEEEVKQKEAPKQRKRPSSDKKPSKITKQKKGEELPPPIANPQDIHESNPEYMVHGKAYCPMDEALPLGKKPLQSAFRKTSDMAEKPKTNAFVYKSRNVQAVAEKESAADTVDNEPVVPEKRTPTVPHHAARPAKRPNIHPTGHGVPEFEYRSPLGPSTSSTATTDAPAPQAQKYVRRDTAPSSSRPPSDTRRRFSAGAEHGSFSNQSFNSNVRPPHSSTNGQFSAGAQKAPYRPQSFNSGGNPANQRGPPHVVQPHMSLPYVGIHQVPPPPPPSAPYSDLVKSAPPPPAAAPISRNAASPDGMLVGTAAPPPALTAQHLPPNDPRPQEKLPEQPKEESKIDFMHAADLLEGIGNELEGTQEEKQPLDPATSLDALASIQQAFDDAF